MTKKEFIQRCCIQMSVKYESYDAVSEAEDFAYELESRGYKFDK